MFGNLRLQINSCVCKIYGCYRFAWLCIWIKIQSSHGRKSDRKLKKWLKHHRYQIANGSLIARSCYKPSHQRRPFLLPSADRLYSDRISVIEFIFIWEIPRRLKLIWKTTRWSLTNLIEWEHRAKLMVIEHLTCFTSGQKGPFQYRICKRWTAMRLYQR